MTLSACDHHNASLATRVHHGRIYAASQLRGRGWSARVLQFAKAILLPIVLILRAMAAMTRSNRSGARLSVLFWLDLMASAWALDEAVGSLEARATT